MKNTKLPKEEFKKLMTKIQTPQSKQERIEAEVNNLFIGGF